MAKVFARADGRVLQPRTASGEFIAGSKCNTHPAHGDRLVADVVTGWITGRDRRFDSSPDGVNGVLLRRFPSLRRCDPRKGKASGQGTDTTLFDGVVVGNGTGAYVEPVGFNVKMCAVRLSKAGAAGSCTGATIRPPAWDDFPSEIERYTKAGGRAPFVAIRAPVSEDGAYVLSSERIEWCIRHPLPEFIGGLPAALGRARGRGAPAKGEILPESWALKVKSSCSEGYSYAMNFRHARTDTPDGWTVGTVADLRDAIVAAATAPR